MCSLRAKWRWIAAAALLASASACQRSNFVQHAERVEPGTEIRVELQAVVETQGLTVDGQVFACVALPEGWSAPSGTWVVVAAETTFSDGATARDGLVPATSAPVIAAEAELAYPQPGSAWHCLTSERMTRGSGTAIQTALAELAVPVPATAQGRLVIPYLTGSRSAFQQPAPDGGVEISYTAAAFKGLLRRTLHVGTGPATTFDHWELATSTLAQPGVKTVPIQGLEPVAVWGQGRFLLTSGAKLLSSEDGRRWTALEPLLDGAPMGFAPTVLVHAQGRFFGARYESIVTSEDGQGWTTARAADAADFRQVMAMAADAGRLVAVGTGGLILSSTDGTSWSDESLESLQPLTRVAAGAGTFVAAGDRTLVRRNVEGTAWEPVMSEGLTGRTIDAVVFGNEQFMLSSRQLQEPAGVDTPLFVSRDGVDWAPLPGFTVQNLPGWVQPRVVLAFVDRTFVAARVALPVSNDAPYLELQPVVLSSSVDGAGWTRHEIGFGGDLSSMSEGGGRIVAVGGSWSVLVAEQRPWAQPDITPVSLPMGVVGHPYAAQVQASGGAEPVRLALTAGALPTGLALDVGSLSGTPTEVGVSVLTFTASDKRGTTATREYALQVVAALAIPEHELPAGTVGKTHRAVVTVAGGAAPYTWSLVTGTPPTGLALAQEGAGYVLSGTPQSEGTTAFTVAVSDASGQSAQAELHLTVAAAEPKPEAQGCGCTQSGGLMGLELLAFGGLALLRRRTRRS